MPHSLFSCLLRETLIRSANTDGKLRVSKKTKSPCSPKGTRTENTISAVPPCLPVNRPLDRRQHAACPVTLAMRQKILKPTLFPSALGGPFAAPLLASLSAVGNSLWMRLQLYFRVCGLLFLKLFPLYTKSNCLSRTFLINFPGLADKRFSLTISTPAPRP